MKNKKEMKKEEIEKIKQIIDEEKNLIREYERNEIVADAVVKSLNKVWEKITLIINSSTQDEK
jgi:allophanate hydrolase subunit 1